MAGSAAVTGVMFGNGCPVKERGGTRLGRQTGIPLPHRQLGVGTGADRQTDSRPLADTVFPLPCRYAIS